jgi:hypothetical protein
MIENVAAYLAGSKHTVLAGKRWSTLILVGHVAARLSLGR